MAAIDLYPDHAYQALDAELARTREELAQARAEVAELLTEENKQAHNAREQMRNNFRLALAGELCVSPALSISELLKLVRHQRQALADVRRAAEGKR